MPRGGWRGPMGTVGGLTRTYGLHRHFGQSDRPRAPLDRTVIRRIGGYFRPYWKAWLLIFLCIAMAAGLRVLPPFCVGLALDRAIPEGDRTLLALLAGAMVGLAVVSGLTGVLQQTLTMRVGQSIMHDLRCQLFAHLQRMSLRFYTSTRSGEIVSRISNDVNAVEGATTGTICSIVSNLMTLLATAVALLSMDWKLALLAVAVVPAFYLPSRLVGRVRRRLATETQENRAVLHAFLQERLHVGGAILTKVFGQAEADGGTFADRSGRVRELQVRGAVVGRWLFMVLSVFSAVGPALVYWYGGLQVMSARLSTGQLVAFAALLTLLYRPLMQLASVYVDIQGAVAVFLRIFEYLDMEPDVGEVAAPRGVPETAGHVALENVSFAYPRPVSAFREDDEGGSGDEDTVAPSFALRDVSFEIRPGEQVALVGPSGAGKTTVTYLVPRFYDPDAGRVRLDGHDLRELELRSLRQHIGMVTQETFLFHDTIRANLLYARPGASERALVAACEAANIHDFIAGLPDGYDTVVGERGFRLSGGEKQRVSIARALLKDPAILILDEATSNLDATSEFLIQQALETLLAGRTSLIIAHRLSTILSSDRIVVLEAGAVAESGTHAELLARNGLYAGLFHQQFGKVLAHET